MSPIKHKCADCKRKANVYCMLTELWWCARCFLSMRRDVRKSA